MFCWLPNHFIDPQLVQRIVTSLYVPVRPGPLREGTIPGMVEIFRSDGVGPDRG